MERNARIVGPALLTLILVGTALAAAPAVTDVTVARARALLAERAGKADFVILDVRTPGEFADGHLAGALNLDVQAPDFEARLTAMDRAKAYLVYCRTGNRSQRAVEAMKRLGFQSVFHMKEGIMGWQQQKFPLSRSS